MLQLARAALRELLRAEHALVFILDAPRKELWTQVGGRPYYQLFGAIYLLAGFFRVHLFFLPCAFF